MEDIRNRLASSRCEDEPSVDVHRAFQSVLDDAYRLKDAGGAGIAEAYAMLTRHDDAARLPYQEIRSEYLLGLYFMYLDQLDTSHDRNGLIQDALGKAAHHFDQGARLAKSVHDWALVEQLKSLESKVCLGSKIHRMRVRRAYSSARAALAAWQRLPERDHTDRDYTAFTLHHFDLADQLACVALLVGEDSEAFEVLDFAGFDLYLVSSCPDLAEREFKLRLLYLDWDWASLYASLGYYRLAFRHVRLAWHYSRDVLRPENQVRLPYMIAAIALDCAENMKTSNFSGYSRERLLAIADKAIDQALANWQACDDHAGHALTLLAEAKWLRLKRRSEGRLEKIELARQIAFAVNDLVLLAQVDIALGDECAFQRKTSAARDYYLKAEKSMTAVGVEQFARAARRRLERLPQPRRSTRQRQILPDISQFAGDYSPN
jgi:hypothetical protein